MTEKLSKIVMVMYDEIQTREGIRPACAIFARPDNRMIIGSAIGAQTKFGEDPNNPDESRFFTGQDAAVEYMKDKCRTYCGRADIDFLVESGTPIVQNIGETPRRRM